MCSQYIVVNFKKMYQTALPLAACNKSTLIIIVRIQGRYALTEGHRHEFTGSRKQYVCRKIGSDVFSTERTRARVGAND